MYKTFKLCTLSAVDTTLADLISMAHTLHERRLVSILLSLFLPL